MKIIKCHIENFGKFSDFTIDFDDEKNVICEENGWGKSTLAAFIKVMLYGFDNDTKKDEFENERKRFRPWQGGVYGGQLIFEAGGKIYEASRVFGAKDKDDIFVLKDDNTGLESSDFSKKLGEELFGLDSKSFSRSIFVSQNACDTSVTDGISAKLGNLTDSTDDIINYEKASTRLTDILNSMSPRRSTGDIYRQKDKMTELKQIISQGTDLESSLDNLVALNKAEKTAIEELKEEQQIWSNRQQETSRYKDLEINKNDFERINKALEEKKDSYEKEKAIFKTSIPDKSELNSKLELAYSLSEKKRALSIYELNEDEISKLSDIDTVLKDESLKIEEEKNIVKSLEKEISDDEINLKNNMDKIKTVESDLSSETYKDYGKLIIKDIIYLIIGIGCLVLVLNLKKVIPALVALMAIAMLVIIVGLFVNIYNYFSLKKNKSINDLDNSISGVSGHANQSRLITYVPKKQEIISTDENDTDKEKAFNNEKESVDEKDNFLKEKEDYINNKKEKLNDKKIRIKELEKLHEQNIYIKNNLTDKKNNYIKVSDEYKSAYNDVKNYLADLGFEPEDDMYKQLDFLEEKIRDIEELKAEVDKISKDKELFNINNDIDAILSAKEIETNYSLTEIDEYLRKIGSEIESHNKNIAGYNRQIDELEERLEYINECENELDELNESYEKKMHKFKMLKETGTLLEEAKAAFTAKYTAPIKNGFDKYYSMITGKSDNTYRLDANIKLSHKELGLDRDTKFLSMGYKDLVGVCMRMALVDAMYEKEKPFIIFDDSFVNLDKDKVEAGLGLLDKIAKEYQIIYFTCHESRV